MNINKQQTKGNKMKKIAMIIGVLTVLASNANAVGWNLPEIISYDNGFGSTSFYSSDRGLRNILQQWVRWNYFIPLLKIKQKTPQPLWGVIV